VRGVGGLRRGNQGGTLRFQLSVFKVWSWAVGQSEAARFCGGAVGLKRRGRRAMIVGAHLSARHREAGALSYDGGGNQAGRRCSTRACWAGRGRRQTGKEWAGVADWANSIGKKKKIKRVLIFEFK
jgi:hypothetical protein